MAASPYKRNRRMKSRLTAGSDDERVNLREKAVAMLTGGRMAPEPVAHANVPGQTQRPRRNNIIRKPESGGTGNHAAPQTAMKNDTLDKGARRPVAKRPASAYNNQLSSLARQRALSGNRTTRGRALLGPRPRGGVAQTCIRIAASGAPREPLAAPPPRASRKLYT
jgi:hypothetical protein